MAERFDIVAKVVSQEGHCAAEHKVGDEWVLGSKTPEGICIPAFNALLPKLRVLMFGGTLPGTESDVTTAACPDAKNPLVIELRRLRQ